MKDWIFEWLKIYKSNSVREITYYNSYVSVIQKHILPYFGDKKLSDITSSNIQEFFNTKIAYSVSLIKKLKTVLYNVFESALVNDKIIKNPFKMILLPRPQSKYFAKRAYTPQQARIVIEFAKSHRFGLDVIIMLKAGLRRSELLALPCRNIDLDNGLIYVSQSVSYASGKMFVYQCKTKQSNRIVPLDAETIDIFRKADMTQEYLIYNRCGEMYSPDSWRQRRYNVIRRDFDEYCRDNNLNLTLYNPHELRHTFGSILYNSGVDIVIISKLMGHSSVVVTSNIYVHPSLELFKNAVNSVKY